MKILILGAAGMVGHQVYLHFLSQTPPAKLGAVLRQPRSHYRNSGFFQSGQIFDQVDLFDFSSLKSVLEKFQPNCVINCIGLTPRKSKAYNEDDFSTVNSRFPHQLYAWTKEHSCRLIHFSTDCVFDGSQGNYSEDAPPTARDLYGQSKAKGEVIGDLALTLRLSFFGRELEGKTEIVEWFLSQKNQSTNGFLNHFYSGVSTHVVAREVYRLVNEFPLLNGLYQISSPPISKFDFLRKLNHIYGLNVNLVPLETERVDKTLNSAKYQLATGFVPPQWDEMLIEMKSSEKTNYDTLDL